MKIAELHDENGTVLIGRVECAESFGERVRGLIGRKPPGKGGAMYIADCPAVHTFMMGFDLDLVFLTEDMAVCRIVRGVVPCRIVLGGRKARSIVEIEAGYLPEKGIEEGARLTLVQEPL